jgi:urease accessory protein
MTSIASAHPGHGADGFVSGISHPVCGLDHLLAMVGVGILAVGLRRAWVWVLPTVFVAMMLLGAILGASGLFVPTWLAENGIAASVFAIGLMVALGAKVPAFAVTPMVGLFAVCHGSAHVAEMPAASSMLGYFTGFLLCTVVLHLAGIGLGLAGGRFTPPLARTAGVATSVCGAFMMVGVL